MQKPTHIQRRGQLTPLVILEEKNLGSPRVNLATSISNAGVLTAFPNLTARDGRKII